MKKILLFALLLVSFSLSGCAGTMQHATITSYEIKNPQIEQKKAFTTVQNILLDKNFDIKISSPDAGLVTTEYKKYGSTGTNLFGGGPPFDFYLQIKTIIRTTAEGETSVKLSPIIKQQNRLNSSAFTEGPLEYYESNDSKHNKRTNKYIQEAMKLFESVVTDVAETLGSTKEEVVKHIEGLEDE